MSVILEKHKLYREYMLEVLHDLYELHQMMKKGLSNESLIINKCMFLLVMSIPYLVTQMYTLLMFALLVVACLYFMIQPIVQKPFLRLFQKEEIATNTFTFSPNIVCEIMWTIFRDNSSAVGIVAPNTVFDIIPVRSSWNQERNGISVIHLIAQKATVNISYDNIQQLLNTKLEQELRISYSAYNTSFSSIPMLHVISVSDDMYHAGYLGFDVVVVDNDAKYQYITKLESQVYKNTLTAGSAVPSRKDDDF